MSYGPKYLAGAAGLSHAFVHRTPVGLCIDMYIGVFVDMCMDMCAWTSAGLVSIYRHVRGHVVDICPDMCTDIRADMCVDLSWTSQTSSD